VVLKTSECAPAVILEFAKLFAKAGLPDGVINVITGHGNPCGKVLTSHPLVARISFTGGPVAAKHILTNSTANFAEVSLELGGKSPFIVFEDADFDSAVNGSVAGIFGASGQSCVAGSRLLVQESVADAFLERMVQIAGSVKIGDPMLKATEMGPLCTYGQLENTERQVARAVEQGARILCGGQRAVGLASDMYFEPTIIDCPGSHLDIVDTELFSPVLSVLRFRTEEEALVLANDTEHGLAAGIFTRDNARALRMSRRIRAGIIWVNTYRAVSPIAEFGGDEKFGLRARKRLSGAFRLHTPKDRVDEHIERALGEPVCREIDLGMRHDTTPTDDRVSARGG
jgi:acyl-CoA reductase-like NAD-dependent aldehyde dehydrogenase